MNRGEVWWADIAEPVGSEPGFRRPALVLQTDLINHSRIDTVIVVLFSGNLRLAAARGNVLLSASETGLPRDSVVVVTQMMTLNKTALDPFVSRLSMRSMFAVEQGVKLALGL